LHRCGSRLLPNHRCKEYTMALDTRAARALHSLLNKRAEEAELDVVEAQDPAAEPVETDTEPSIFVSEGLFDMLCKQYTREAHSSEIYQGLGVYCSDIGLSGFGKYFYAQACEERTHANMFRDFIVNDLNKRLEMGPIEGVPSRYDSPVDAFEAQLKHEKQVTGWINDIARQALQENNMYVLPFAQCMLKEQMEEEAKSYEFLLRVRMAGDGAGLRLIDREVGATD